MIEKIEKNGVSYINLNIVLCEYIYGSYKEVLLCQNYQNYLI